MGAPEGVHCRRLSGKAEASPRPGKGMDRWLSSPCSCAAHPNPRQPLGGGAPGTAPFPPTPPPPHALVAQRFPASSLVFMCKRCLRITAFSPQLVRVATLHPRRFPTHSRPLPGAAPPVSPPPSGNRRNQLDKTAPRETDTQTSQRPGPCGLRRHWGRRTPQEQGPEQGNSAAKGPPFTTPPKTRTVLGPNF